MAVAPGTLTLATFTMARLFSLGSAIVMTDCFGDSVILPNPSEAAKLFDEQTGLIMPTGTPGQTIWIGADDNRKILRVDIDIDAGRAAKNDRVPATTQRD